LLLAATQAGACAERGGISVLPNLQFGSHEYKHL
jgi:hypothetical protein